MASKPVLLQPNSAKEFFLDTDASDVGLGAVLVQRDDEGHFHPVAYGSRKLNPAESRYSTREQEALAIVWGIDKFLCFLRGRRFTVITDHRSLSWLLTAPLTKGRLTTWTYRLREHDFSIVYRRGADNQVADYLSRAVYALVPASLRRWLGVRRRWHT